MTGAQAPDGVVVRVSEVVEETPDIRTLRLVRADDRPFSTRYSAGAHVDVTGPTGVLRQYSLCSDPDDPTSVLIAVKREPDSRGGSAALHEVRQGDRLRIGRPRNLLGVADGADRHLLVAGGIGITPLLSLAYELHSRGADFHLLYFARSEAEAAFVALLRDRAEFRHCVQLHLGIPRSDQQAVLAAAAADLTPRSHVYTCGPTGFMDHVAAVLSPVVGSDHLHREAFVAAQVETAGDTAFTVELDTGEAFEVPAGRSILSVLEDNGIEVFKSCEEGVCGSCVSTVLEGVPDHRDNCLSAADRASGTEIALCVSRARSDKLVIELS